MAEARPTGQPPQTDEVITVEFTDLDYGNAYADGDQFSHLVKIPNAALGWPKGIATLMSVVLIDLDSQGQGVEAFFFDREVEVPATLNAAMAIGDEAGQHCVGHVVLDTLEDGGAWDVLTAYGIGLVMKPANGSDLYVLLKAGGAITAAKAWIGRFGFIRS